MLKKISTSQLRIGMHVHQLVGAWLDHPFWKKAFLLADRKQLDRILASPIRELWIDTSLGLDVEEATDPVFDETPLDANALETMIATQFAGPVVAGDDPACSLADELERAGRIVASGRAAMKAMFEDARLGHAIDTGDCLPLVEEITQSIDRNPGAIVSLARLKTSDDYTYMHSVAVCALMILLARTLGLPDAKTREAGLAGLVHDIGKIRMPPGILNKPGALTPEEFALVRRHPQAGYDVLRKAAGIDATSLDVCLHHHEKVNGKGYPFGLPRGRISLMARMGAVCDVYDAITSNRPYKSGWDPSLSIQRMAQWSREGHFDDDVMQAFVKSLGIYPIGSLVHLASGRVAVVVDQATGHLLKPVVRTILDFATREPCDLALVDLHAEDCDDRIVARLSPDALGLTDIARYWRIPDRAPTPA